MQIYVSLRDLHGVCIWAFFHKINVFRLRIRGRIFFYSLEDWMRNEDRWRRIESYMRSVSFFAPSSDFAIELIVVANFRLKAMEALIAKKNAKKRRQKKKWEQSPTAQRPSGPTIFMFIRLHFKQSSCADSVSRTLGQWFQIEHVWTCSTAKSFQLHVYPTDTFPTCALQRDGFRLQAFAGELCTSPSLSPKSLSPHSATPAIAVAMVAIAASKWF